jgi:hypothetical protein
MTDVSMTAEAAISDGSPESATKALDALAAKFRGPAPSATPTDSIGAQARLDALVKDPTWAKSYWEGNPAARREFSELTQKIANGNPTADALNAKPDAKPDAFTMEVTVGGELSSRNRADAVAGLRQLGLDDATVTQALDGAPVNAQEVAMAKMMKAAKLSDAAWTDRWLKGGLLERSEMTKINVILSSVAA